MQDYNYTSGFIAGITRALISQPFDTIKTKMQTSYYKTSIECLKTTINNDGFMFLYKGIAFPLIGNSFILGSQFYTYNYLNNFPPLISGGFAGLISSFISNPIELVRIKMQLSDKLGNNKNYKNSFICLKHIIEHNGITGIFKGQQITTIRDIVGYASFFYVYENYKYYEKYFNYIANDNEIIHKMIKGSLCGFALWTSMYPIDVIKTIVQGNLLEKKQESYSHYIKNVYKTYGINGFYRGFYLTMFRAIPVNIGIILALDFCK
jgi:solute carrier family 25 carnitine/acylcarnitine transporter 20/29